MAREGATRRDVLKTGSALMATGAVSAMAGCSVLGGGFSYTKWLHAPGEVNDGTEHYSFYHSQPKAILAKEDKLDSSFVETYESEGQLESATGIDPESVKNDLNYAQFRVKNGGFKKGEVTSELEDNGFEEDTDHKGFKLFLNEDTNSNYYGYAIGVSGSSIVGTRGSPQNADLVGRLETAVDTRKGSGSRYVQEVEAMKTLSNKLGTQHVTSGSTMSEVDQAAPQAGRFAGQVGQGFGLKIKGSNSKVRAVYVFEDNGAASDADVDEWIDTVQEGQGLWSKPDELNKNVSGKAVVVKGTVESDKLGN